MRRLGGRGRQSCLTALGTLGTLGTFEFKLKVSRVPSISKVPFSQTMTFVGVAEIIF
jgi:hypothetical protein